METPARPRVFEDSNQLRSLDRPPIVAIGFFDGVHRGHQAILTRLVERARRQDRVPTVLTFAPHPQKVISPGDAPLLLLQPVQKRELLAAMGVEVILEIPFTRRLSLYSPLEFARRYLEPLGAEEIHVGRDFRFGHRRAGDFSLLQRLGKSMNFHVLGTPEVTVRGQRISSTRIRRHLEAGRVEVVRRLLGRSYELIGHVVRGDGRGAGIGFPTANLRTRNELIPAAGVYAGRAKVDGKSLTAATNVGLRPTFGEGGSRLQVETHVFDFDRNLYGQPIRVDFCLRLRAERRFAGREELKAQIERDVARTRDYADRVRRQAGEVG